MLCVLEGAGIPFHLIAGTSIGAIIGALYAGGMSTEEFRKEAVQGGSFSKVRKLIDLELVKGTHLLKGNRNRIRKLLADYLGEERQFSELRLPFAVVTVDLLTGREVVIRDGNAFGALQRCSAR